MFSAIACGGIATGEAPQAASSARAGPEEADAQPAQIGQAAHGAVHRQQMAGLVRHEEQHLHPRGVRDPAALRIDGSFRNARADGGGGDGEGQFYQPGQGERSGVEPCSSQPMSTAPRRIRS